MIYQIRYGGQVFSIKVTSQGNKLALRYHYNPKINEFVKRLKGKHFDPEKGIWTIDNCTRNLIVLTNLSSPSSPEIELKHFETNLPLFDHQKLMCDFIFTKKQAIIAGQMGIGKTLSAIAIIEKYNSQTWWIVCPKSVRYVWESEFRKFGVPIFPTIQFINYNRLFDVMTKSTVVFPDNVVFDEAHFLKNPEAQRTEAAMVLADIIRNKSNGNADNVGKGFIILFSGTPSPKDPTDWWSLCEITKPGFLIDASKSSLAKQLGEFTTGFGHGGKEYPSLVRWIPERLLLFRDKLKEISLSLLKKDCLSLPEKIYQTVFLPVSPETKQHMNFILSMEGKGVTVLNKLRQISDGFMYHSTCSSCIGEGKIKIPLLEEKAICPYCSGTGEDTLSIFTPKDEQLEDDLKSLEESEENRVVIYAAYHKSIDKIIQILLKRKWKIIKMDGRGLVVSGGIPTDWFPTWETSPEKIAYIGHPKSGGIGINLQKSELAIFYSNDFDGASRPQAEDRIHRVGTTKTIIRDYFYLPTDAYIFENLKKKKNLQGVTMFEIKEYVEEFSQEKFYEQVSRD